MAIGILSLLDDVAALMDDVAIMSKVASKKVAGVLGDDLAVNVENATGFHASRELPVLWAISKWSLLNKVIILPVVFLLSAFMEWIVVPILLLGGAYLSYEGAEKVYEWFSPSHKEKPAAIKTLDKQEMLKAEKLKIKSAVRTDFILSVEIVVLALGTVMQETLIVRIMAVSFVALLATIGVYGLVALLVRVDDVGISLIERSKNMEGGLAVFTKKTGEILVKSLPKIIHLIGYVATIAMLLVGGGIFTHNIHVMHNIAALIPSLAGDLCVGLAVGMVLLVVSHLVARINSYRLN
jgi:predicted DNA repair protein MutK